MLAKISRWKVRQVLGLEVPEAETTLLLTIERDWPIWRWFFRPRVVVQFDGKTCYGKLSRDRKRVRGDYFGQGTFEIEQMPPDSHHPVTWLRCLVDLLGDREENPKSTATWTADEDGP